MDWRRIGGGLEEDWGLSEWVKITKNNFLRFFCFLPPLFRRFRLPRVPQTADLDEIYRLVSKIIHFMACGSELGRFGVSCKNFVDAASKFYRNCNEILSKFYRNSIEILSKFYRNSIEILSKFYRNSIAILTKFYRNAIEITTSA